MPTLTWTGKEDALRAASLVPFRLLEPHQTHPYRPGSQGRVGLLFCLCVLFHPGAEVCPGR